MRFFKRRMRVGSSYRSGSMKKSKKQIILRVLFVLLCTFLLTSAAVMLGNHLGNKAAFSSESVSSENSSESETSGFEPSFQGAVPADPQASKNKVCAAFIDITENIDSIIEKIDSLSADYNSISIDIFSESGKLSYLSPALMESVGLDNDLMKEIPAEEEFGNYVDVYSNIVTLSSIAKEKGLTLSAVFDSPILNSEFSSDDFYRYKRDTIIIKELCDLGFDEIIINGLIGTEGILPKESLDALVKYVSSLRGYAKGIRIGVTIPHTVYIISQNAALIKTLSVYVDFLAIDIDTVTNNPEEAYSDVYDSCYSLKGNFSVYNLRGIIKNKSPEISEAIYSSLKSLGAESFRFSAFVPAPSYVPDNVTASSDSSDNAPTENNNALREEDYTANDASDSE